MFSWLFRKWPQAGAGASRGRRDMEKGAQLLERIAPLRTVKLPFFQGLLTLTDQVSDQVIELYEPFRDYNAFQVHGFCACIVTSAISMSILPDDEKPLAMDIYLDLWVDNVVRKGRNIEGHTLKERLYRAWEDYRPFIFHAEAEPVQNITHKPAESASRGLLANVDRIAGVSRGEFQQQVAATVLKCAIVEAFLAVDALADPRAQGRGR